jgi:hypothetical protein
VVQFSFEGTFWSVAGRRSEHAQLQHVSGRLVEGTNAGAIKQMIRPQAMRSLRSDAVAKWGSICACRRCTHIPFAHDFRYGLSYMMFDLIYKAAVQPSFCNVVNICEAMSISSIFTLHAMITSMSTMQCVEHGVLNPYVVSNCECTCVASWRGLNILQSAPDFVTLELVWSYALSYICCFDRGLVHRLIRGLVLL